MSKNDGKIKLMMAKVAEMKKNLGEKPRAVLKTNGLVEVDGKKMNINVMSADEIVLVFGNLLSEEKAVSEAANKLGVSDYTFKVSGFTLADWETDFKNRVANLEYQKRKAKLDATEAQLKSLMSEDARTEAALEEIEKGLS